MTYFGRKVDIANHTLFAPPLVVELSDLFYPSPFLAPRPPVALIFVIIHAIRFVKSVIC